MDTKKEAIMNYLIVLLLTLFSTSNLKIIEDIKVGARFQGIVQCTESDDSEIILVHGILTSTGVIAKRDTTVLKAFKFEIDDEALLKKPDLLMFLVDKWKQKKVSKVQEHETCTSISKVLESDLSSINGSELFDRIYYKVEDRYLVIYNRKDFSTRNIQIPYQILDEDFNVVGNFSL